MERKFLLVGNWKANKNESEIDQWIQEMSPLFEVITKNADWLTVAVAPPTLYLRYFKTKTVGTPIQLAAQDVSGYPNGSYTGEVTGKMLAETGVKYVFVGHSERRKFLNESPTLIEKKVAQAISEGIVPIIGCQTIEEVPATIRNFDSNQYVIMYEPFEAISNDAGFHPVTSQKIDQVISDWPGKLNLKIKLVYGGSVTEAMVADLKTIPNLDGAVVGRASLEAKAFSSIIKSLVA